MNTIDGRNQTTSKADYIINIAIKTFIVVAAFVISFFF